MRAVGAGKVVQAWTAQVRSPEQDGAGEAQCQEMRLVPSGRCLAHRAGVQRCYYSQSRVALPWFDGKGQSQPLDGGASLRNPRKEALDEVFCPRPDGTSWASQDPGHEFLLMTGELGGGALCKSP